METENPTVTGSSTGLSNGESAGQTIFHCHIHLIPRDRAGTFEPQLIKKHETTISDEIEVKISLYGFGTRYRDIATQVQEIYDISVRLRVTKPC